jgi:hypothetical protein
VKVLPSGAAPVSGKVNTCVTLDASQQFFNAEPYVQRHFDIEPVTSNTTSTSATVTLYFTDAEFVQFNTNNPVWPKLPTAAGGGSTDPDRANLKITQYHGTANSSPSTPGNYSAGGGGILINPPDADIVWNGSYWAVTFDVTGFSGFYAHSNPLTALPVTFKYLNGVKQGNDHQLTWSVSCNSTTGATMMLEHSTDAKNFSGIYSISVDAAHCNQPFNYTNTNTLNGLNYYRLKIVDANGKITYSNMIALINGTKGFALMSISPNPVINNISKLNVTAAVKGKINLNITDVRGRVVHMQTIQVNAGFNSIDINVQQLAAGTYFLRATNDETKGSTLPFVVR